MNWHIQALAYDLEQVRLGRIKRLIINLPPRFLKSLIASIAFPAFVLGHDPTKRIIVISYGLELATKFAYDSAHGNELTSLQSHLSRHAADAQ